MASLDPRTLEELRALQTPGEPAFLAELIDLYMQESAKQLDLLRSAFAAKDAVALERAAHTMKGMSGNLGARLLSGLFSELQKVARAADWTRTSDLISRIEPEHLAALAELKIERNR